MSDPVNRREFLSASAQVAAAAALAGVGAAHAAAGAAPSQATESTRPWKHSVCRWCYSGVPLDTLMASAKELGVSSIELLDEPDWTKVREAGLQCAVANGPTGITKGFNRVENHDAFIAKSQTLLPKVAKAGIPCMIVFSGNRAGLSDEDGLRNCTIGLKRLMPLAEAAGVTVVMELLNSKVDHRDYQCDRTPWGAELVKRVGSDRFRLLYDIYHMQIMEGDVMRTIEKYNDSIAHYHTGGVPGRHEIDSSQELFYPAICRAITATGFTGYLGQEFIPARDPFKSLGEAVKICSV